MPTQLEDLNEVIEEDGGIVPFTTYNKPSDSDDSGYHSLKRKSEKEVQRLAINV